MTSDYEGIDLEAMSSAVNYRGWILDDIRPFLGRRLLEVGAGIGSFTKMLAAENPEYLVALEPSSSMFVRLSSAVEGDLSNESGRLVCGGLRDVAKTLADARLDTILYINVLEHIEDDATELDAAYRLLCPGGVLIIYVPALPALFGPFDQRIGHYRRYTRTSLRQVVEGAGFEIGDIGYRDLFGVAPWFISARILKSRSINKTSVRFYDKIIPIVRFIDRLTGPPVGKNLLVIARCQV